MNEPIDKLIFALDGDLTALKARYAEAEADASKTGKKIADNLNAPLKAAASQAATSANAVKKALGEVEQATTRGHGAASTATREFRALFDELSSGRTRQTPGTLAIIATRVFGISTSTLAAAVAIAAIPAAFAYAAVKADESLAKIRTSLALTANAAGIGANQGAAIAQQIAAASGSRYSQMGAQAMVGALAGGMVPGQFIGQAAGAGANYSLATGAKDEEIQKLLSDMFSDPAKTAEELNRQMHLLTAEQTRQVEELQRSGEYEKAGQIVLDAFTKRSKDAADSASWLSKMLDQAGVAVGGFMGWLGRTLGAGVSDQNKLYAAQGALDWWKSRQRELQQKADLGPVKSGLSGLEYLQLSVAPNKIAQLQRQVVALQSIVSTDTAAGAAGGLGSRADRAIGNALADSDKGAGAFEDKLKSLQEQLNRDQLAVHLATQTHSKYTDVLIKQRDAVALALKNQLDPAAEAALRTKEQQRIDAAAPGQRTAISQAVEAERARRQNLANPATALYADSIYRSQMAAAGGAHYNAHDAALGERQDRNMAAMQQEADAAEDVAKALDVSTAAAVRAKIAGEAHLALVKKEIADETTYAAALQRRAFAQAAAAAAENIATVRNSNAGLRGVAAATGNPASVAAARRAAEALAATQTERDNAVTAVQIAMAQKHLDQLRQEFDLRDRLNRTINDASVNEGLQNEIDLTQKELDLKYEDASVRAKEIADLQAVIALKQEGWSVDDAGYQEALARRRQLLEAKAALTTETKDQQVWGSLRSGLSSTLLAGTQGFKNMAQAAASFMGQLGQMVLQLYVIGPLLNMLLGKSGTSGGGLLGGVLSSIGKVIGGIFGGGKAGGGNLDPTKFYMVGEQGPELLGPGVSGKITPLKAPMVSVPANSNHSAAASRVDYSITVSGNGDKELLSRMEAVADVTVSRGLQSNNKMARRVLRGNMIASQKRALS